MSGRLMPPHCDTLDGPVVLAAKRALETGNVNLVLPWVFEGGEKEVLEAFNKVIEIKNTNIKEAIDVAEYWFYETVVRVHRQGEGAPYTGLKPAGLDFGPILPLVDKSIELGNPIEVVKKLQHAIEHSIIELFNRVLQNRNYDMNDVKAARKYVNSYLEFALYSHHLYENIRKSIHISEVEENASKDSHHH